MPQSFDHTLHAVKHRMFELSGRGIDSQALSLVVQCVFDLATVVEAQDQRIKELELEQDA